MNPSPSAAHQQSSASPESEGESPAARRQPMREVLIAEIERYLDAVECFRALDSEPCWVAIDRGDLGSVETPALAAR